MRQAPAQITGAGADVGHSVARAQAQRLQQQIGALFLLAFGAFEPIGALVPHDLRNFAAFVKLANAIGIVLGIVSVGRRSGGAVGGRLREGASGRQEAAQAKKDSFRGGHGSAHSACPPGQTHLLLES